MAKELSGSIEITYRCDACTTETVDAPLPSDWRKVVVYLPNSFGAIKINRYMGPICLASMDPAVFEAMKAMILSPS